MVSKEEEIYYMEIIIESSIYKKISIIDESDCSKEEKDRLKQEVIDKFVLRLLKKNSNIKNIFELGFPETEQGRTEADRS